MTLQIPVCFIEEPGILLHHLVLVKLYRAVYIYNALILFCSGRFNRLAQEIISDNYNIVFNTLRQNIKKYLKRIKSKLITGTTLYNP